MTSREALHALVALVVAVAASYMLAGIGEPQSVWLWRDMLGVLR